MSGWQTFDEQARLLSFEYAFGSIRVRSIAIGVEGGYAVVSPPYKPAPQTLDDIERHGAVRALVASNGFHHMGLPAWHARFPNATLHAPAQSIARIQRQHRLDGIEPLSQAPGSPGTGLQWIDLPYYRTGELLLRVDGASGTIWYVTDMMSNLAQLPAHPIFRTAYRLTRSAPGLRYNNLASLFMVRDKRALKRWLAEMVEADPPRWLIPAHGEILDLRDGVEPLRAVFRD